jgi:hypothetical protein
MGPGILSAPAAFKPLQPFEMKPNFFQSNGSMFVNRMFWRGLRSRTVDDLKPGLRTFYMLVKRKQSSRTSKPNSIGTAKITPRVILPKRLGEAREGRQKARVSKFSSAGLLGQIHGSDGLTEQYV